MLIKRSFQLSEWQNLVDKKFSYKAMSLIFPADNAQEWRKLFKPCAAQRLFLPVNYIFCMHKSEKFIELFFSPF